LLWPLERAFLFQERERQIAELQQKLDESLRSARTIDSAIEQAISAARQIEADLNVASAATPNLEQQYKTKKATIKMLPEADKHLAELQQVVQASRQRLIKFAQDWEEMRAPLIEQHRRQKQVLSERKAAVGRKVELIKRMRLEMKDSATEIRDKEKVFHQVSEDLSKLPKSINRQAYVNRIMDICRNLDRQKVDIDKIIDDVKRLQREINQTSDTSQRSFAFADDIIYKAAKTRKDEVSNKSYKNLIQLREAFVALVKCVEDTGRAQNEARDLSAKIAQLESRNTHLNMEKVESDLLQVKQENKALMTKIKALRS